MYYSGFEYGDPGSKYIDVTVKRIGSSGTTYKLTASEDLGVAGFLRGIVGIGGQALLIKSLETLVVYAKELCPVATGELQRSIDYQLFDNTTGAYGSPLPYALFVNDGTIYKEGRHFLEGALDMLKGDLA